MQKQHFVFLNQYYPPDLAPTGVMLRDVAEEMVSQGNLVTIICSKGGYSGGGEEDLPDRDGIRVISVPSFRFGRGSSFGKICDYLSFYVFAFFSALSVSGKPSCYVALTTPPYLSVITRIVSRVRGADHAHWVMDLYPDVLVAHGLLKEGDLRAKYLLAISRWGFGGRRNRKTVSLGPDMEKRLELSHDVSNGVWIPLWSTVDADENAEEAGRLLRKERGWEGKTVFLYSGNMGLGHRLSEFLFLAKEKQATKDLVFAFYGSGKRKQEVEAFVHENPGASVEVGDYVPEELLAAHLHSADVHLASLEPSWDGCMVPSKIQGIFASARPVLFVGSKTCAIGQWISDANAGWIVPPGEQELLVDSFREALEHGIRNQKGEDSCLFSTTRFSKNCNTTQLVNELYCEE